MGVHAQDEPWFCIAGFWRTCPEGDAFSMLTTAPGADVEPYHNRQIVILRRVDWRAWLDGSDVEAELLKPLPPGSLNVSRIV